jgi:hypothetical protein
MLSGVIETAVEQNILLEEVDVSGNWCGILSLREIVNCVQCSKVSKPMIEDLNFDSDEDASGNHFLQ